MNTLQTPPRLFRRQLSLLAICSLLLVACSAPDTPTANAPAAPAAGDAATAAPASGAAVPAGGDNCESVTSEIKLGFSTSLTGGTADLGGGHRKGFLLAVNEYNAKGGHNGTPVQCIVLDDQTKPDQGVANITRLIDQDRVIGLIAFTNTGVANAALKKIQDSEIPLIVPVATGTVITQQFADQAKNYVFRMSMPDIFQVGVMMEFLDKNGYTKPAIMHDTTGYGKLGAEDITKALAAKSLTPVVTENFQYGDTDMTGQLTRARNGGADVIMTYALAPELANLLKSLDRLGWYPPVVGSWTLAQPDMVKFAGIDVVKKFKINMVQSFTVDRDETSKAFNDKVVAAFGENPVPITAAQAYDATNLFLAALDKAGPDPKAIRDAIEATDTFKGVTTAPTKPYDAKDHEAIDQKDMFMAALQEENGQMRVIKVP